MKVLKTLKIVLVLTVLIISTSCNPEEINPKETKGGVDYIVVND